jgi:hypothetical protein
MYQSYINNPMLQNLAKSIISLLLEIGLDFAVFHSINHQLKDQIRTLDLHVQFKVQVREFLAFAGRQSGEQALWYRR